MNITSLKCPECGAPLNPTANGKQFCSHCGTPVFIDDGQIFVNINKTTHIIDDAKIEAEKSKVELKKIEMEDDKNRLNFAFVLVVAMIIVVLLFNLSMRS